MFKFYNLNVVLKLLRVYPNQD